MKHIALVIFFSILMLVPAAIFPPQQASATIEDNLYKFDEGFYELIQQQIPSGPSGQSGEIPTQYVLINIIDGNETQLKEILENMNAKNIFVSNKLDFVTADVPVNRIAELVTFDFIYKIGDEPDLEPQGLSMSQAKAVVGAPSFTSDNFAYTGRGVTVGVIDTGVDFSHPDLQNKKVGKASCVNASGCLTESEPRYIDHVHNHGTALAGIIAADSSNNSRDGVAPNSRIYDIILVRFLEDDDSKTRLSHTLDHISINGISIAMTSLAGVGTCNNYSSLAIVIDKAVNSGISFSTPIGNENNNGFLVQACGLNSISVGSVDSNKNHFSLSSQGPAKFNTPSGDADRIKPEITAIGVDLNLPKVIRNGESNYSVDTGTSYANAFVAGASALIKEKQSDYTSREIKAALLLGADWKANVPATANDYDNKITGIYDTMNKYGFGVLNIEKSLDYSNANEFPNIIKDSTTSRSHTDSFRITANQNDQVKVLVSWFIQPGGSINDPTLPLRSSFVTLPNHIINYDLKITYPDGTVKRSNSNTQNNEFIVFVAPQPGNYVINVGSGRF